jgi:hypothetical protein
MPICRAWAAYFCYVLKWSEILLRERGLTFPCPKKGQAAVDARRLDAGFFSPIVQKTEIEIFGAQAACTKFLFFSNDLARIRFRVYLKSRSR